MDDSYNFAEQAEAIEDRSQAAIHEADEIVQAANNGGIAIASEVRREALAAMRKLVRQGLQPRELMHQFFAEFRSILRRYDPFLAKTASDATLAAYLKGGKTVVDALLREARGAADPFPRYLADLGSDQPPNEPPVTLPRPAHEEPRGPVRFPIIEEAAKILQARRVMTPEDFYGASARERLAGFTVSRVASLDAIQRVQEAIIHAVADGDLLRTFTKRVEDSIDRSQLSPARLELIFRTGTMSAYTRGLQAVLKNPLLGPSAFPFIQRRGISDSRQTPLCRVLSSSGLPLAPGARMTWAVTPEGYEDRPLVLRGRKFWTGQPVNPKWIPDFSAEERAIFATKGSQYLWILDPLWGSLFCPPSHHNCRCCASVASLEDAAKAGVAVAIEWLRTGVQPEPHRLCVPHPGVELPPNWTPVWSDSATAA